MGDQSSPRGARSTSKRDRTRSALLRAARQVFEERGYDGTRIADVVALAGVGHGTFYRYFTSKNDVFRAIALDVYDELLNSYDMSGAATTSPGVLLPRAQHQYLMAYRKNARFLGLTEQVAAIDPTVGEMRGGVRRRHSAATVRYINILIDRGEVEADIDVEYTAELIRAMVDRFAYTWFVLDEEFEEDRALVALSSAYLRLIGWSPHDE